MCSKFTIKTTEWRLLLWYSNQLNDLQNKSIDCFLYDGNKSPSAVFTANFEQIHQNIRHSASDNIRRWRRSSVFIVNFEHILHLFLAFLLLTGFYIMRNVSIFNIRWAITMRTNMGMFFHYGSFLSCDFKLDKSVPFGLQIQI